MARTKVTQDWDAIKRDPVEFAEKLLLAPDGSPFRTFEAQANILRNVHRRTVANTGRQFSNRRSYRMPPPHRSAVLPPICARGGLWGIG